MRNVGVPYEAVDPEIKTLAESHGRDPQAVLELLRILQERHGGLTERTIEDTARALRINAARVYGIASFYSLLSTELRPQRRFRICDGPPWWLRGAAEVRAAAEEAYGE